jgi:hypothetical protein
VLQSKQLRWLQDIMGVGGSSEVGSELSFGLPSMYAQISLPIPFLPASASLMKLSAIRSTILRFWSMSSSCSRFLMIAVKDTEPDGRPGPGAVPAMNCPFSSRVGFLSVSKPSMTLQNALINKKRPIPTTKKLVAKIDPLHLPRKAVFSLI